VPGIVPPQQTQRNLQDTLLAAIDELIAAYESAVADQPDAPPARPVDRREVQTEAIIAAGPFASVPEVREFARALAEMPGVRDVHVRGYTGVDRAIIEVTLGPTGEPPPRGATQ
jgi:hypothetical protein